MFGVQNKIKGHTRSKGIYDTAKTLRLMLKLAGLFPFKIEETASGTKAVYCKFGGFCTLFHLIVYLSSVIHFVFLSNEKIYSLNYGKIGDYGYIALLVLEGIASVILFSSVFTSIKNENRVILYTSQIDKICQQLQMDNTAVFIKSKCLIRFFIFMLVVIYFFGAGHFIYTQFASRHGAPLIDLIIIGILPHLYIQIKITSFLIYILALNVGHSEFYNFLESYLKNI